MPKIPPYTLAWSSTIQAYELYETHDREVLKITPDSPAWFAWLDQIPSFAFFGKTGHYTARKEVKQRGDRYWYAYLATGKQLTKKYLGKTTDLTMVRLEQIAGILCAQSVAQVPSHASLSAASTHGEVDSLRHPLLATKLHVPRPRAHLISRAHLIERLQRGVERALTLVSAPAGFGKTTLLSQWLAEGDMPVAWLSLEPEDNDPTRFLSYLIAALQTLDSQIGATALAMLNIPQPAPPAPEIVLAVLANDLVSRDAEDFALVLDDYHVITADPIHRGMTFLLEHLPPQMHLILASRADPPLPLARLRARGQLSEVRSADLRFGTLEVGAFLREVMGLDLSASAIAALESRTEGWIAGLQLAALSLQGRADVTSFLTGFTGTHRFVLEYLSEEVLMRQSTSVRRFLLQTSILDRLSGPLCDAVTAQEGSQAMLEALEKANLFVVALDDERRWYRYHHLFADVLRNHLQQTELLLIPELHRRASAWYEQHDLPVEAVQHALAIPDVELAARLIEPIALQLTLQGQIYTVLEWMNAFPKELEQAHPLLCLYHASFLSLTNQLEAAEARVQEAERYVPEALPARQRRIVLGGIDQVRARIAVFSGNIPQAILLARRSLELLPEDEVIPRMGAIDVMAHAYLVSGDVTPAEHEIATAHALVHPSINVIAAVSCITLLARLHVLQGRLREAAATYARVVQVVPRPEVLQTIFNILLYYFGLGNLLREWNDLEAAERHLLQGMALVNDTLTVEPFVAALGYTALARLQQARGNTLAALATLDALERLAEQRHFAVHLMPQLAAVRAQLELARGNKASAIRWADSSGLSVEDADLPYPREGEYLALVRVRIAQARADPATPFLQDALHLLDRLLQDAEPKARMGSVLEILVLHALALEVQGNRPGALSTLRRALALAEPEGYIRLFVDEGPPMFALLRHAHARGIASDYIATLLAAFGEQQAPTLPLSPRPGSLLEPLTEREVEVLRLVARGLTDAQVAETLVISPRTVNAHLRSIYSKLNITSRNAATHFAIEHHLI